MYTCLAFYFVWQNEVQRWFRNWEYLKLFQRTCIQFTTFKYDSSQMPVLPVSWCLPSFLDSICKHIYMGNIHTTCTLKYIKMKLYINFTISKFFFKFCHLISRCYKISFSNLTKVYILYTLCQFYNEDTVAQIPRNF